MGVGHVWSSVGAVLRSVWSRIGGGGLQALLLVAMPVHAQGMYGGTGTIATVIVPAGQPDHSHQPRVSLTVTDSTIEYVLNELGRQAHMRVAYNDRVRELQKRVRVWIVDAEVPEALTTILRGTGLVGKVMPDGETVLIGPKVGGRARVAGGVVMGRVTDSAGGAGLSGAAVKVAGTTLAAVTSDSGYFTLRNVPAGEQVLSVRLFGYRLAERTVTVVDSQRTTVRIVLIPVPTVLSGVVTTAAGQQRKIEVGNDITTLNVDSIRKVAPINSVTDLLETRVPGLTVLHSSGTPGDPSRLRIRGDGSIFSNNDPIVIVNGVRVYARQSDARSASLAQALQARSTNGTGLVAGLQNSYTAPSPIDQIDPASIETIEVLKGPSATAIYGSDAAGGVIVITTKRGRVGPSQWDATLGAGVNWSPGNWPVNYFRFGQDGTGRNMNGLTPDAIPIVCQWYQLDCQVDSIVPFQALNDPRYTVFGHGSDQQASLTVSGGTPALTYSVTGSGTGDMGLLRLPTVERQRYDSAYGPIPHGLLRPDNYTTWGVNGSVTMLPTSEMRVTLGSSLLSSTQHQSSLQSAIQQLEGEYVDPAFIALGGAFIPYDVEQAQSAALTSTNTLSLHWQPLYWLPFDATAGVNSIARMDNAYIPYGVNPCGVSSNGFGCDLSNDTAGYYSIGRGTSRDQTLNIGTVVPLRLLSVAFGGNLYSNSTADLSVWTAQLAPGVSVPTTFLDQDGRSVSPTNSMSDQSTYGWYVEPRLNVASRFFVTPGFRLDGGSGGSHSASSVNGLSAFPKIDLSYVAVDRQGGRPLAGMLSLLRPRFAFGLAGIQPLPQEVLRLYNVGSFSTTIPNTNQNILGLAGSQATGCQPTVILDGINTVPAVCLNVDGNTQLRPERTQELEGGFDAIFWRGRVSVTYTQYNKTTKDAMLDIPVAASVGGVGGIVKNIGVIRNTGTELTLNTVLVESRALSWNVGVNLSNDNNVVVRLNPGQQPLCYGISSTGGCIGTRVVAGYPIFGEWSRPIASFADVNHDGIIEPSEVRLADSSVYVGQPNPKYQFNLNTGATLLNGRLSVNATFAYMNGLTQNNIAACQSGSFQTLANAPTTPLSTQAAIVASNCVPGLPGSGGSNVTDIGLIQTVNVFRFNDLSLNYNVPRSVSTRIKIPRMSVAIQGSNLGLQTNYRGKDPAVNAFSTVTAGDETADLGQLPEPRTWWLKVTLGNH